MKITINHTKPKDEKPGFKAGKLYYAKANLVVLCVKDSAEHLEGIDLAWPSDFKVFRSTVPHLYKPFKGTITLEQ